MLTVRKPDGNETMKTAIYSETEMRGLPSASLREYADYLRDSAKQIAEDIKVSRIQPPESMSARQAKEWRRKAERARLYTWQAALAADRLLLQRGEEAGATKEQPDLTPLLDLVELVSTWVDDDEFEISTDEALILNRARSAASELGL